MAQCTCPFSRDSQPGRGSTQVVLLPGQPPWLAFCTRIWGHGSCTIKEQIYSQVKTLCLCFTHIYFSKGFVGKKLRSQDMVYVLLGPTRQDIISPQVIQETWTRWCSVGLQILGRETPWSSKVFSPKPMGSTGWLSRTRVLLGPQLPLCTAVHTHISPQRSS